MDGRSRFGVSAFFMDYTDLQVQTPIAVGVIDIRNAAAATIAASKWRTRPGSARRSSRGHVAWLDATYDRYIAVAVGGATGDVSGNRLNNAPEWAGRLWIEWTGDVGRLRSTVLSRRVDAQSTVFYTPFNDSIQRQSPYGLLGARVEYGPGSRRWTVGAYVRNLTEHGLRHWDLRNAAQRVCRTARTLASVRHGIRRPAMSRAQRRCVPQADLSSGKLGAGLVTQSVRFARGASRSPKGADDHAPTTNMALKENASVAAASAG